MRYKPWGETRYTWTAALSTTPAYALTKYTFTGQYSYMGDFGLMFYNARWYDSALGRFTSADSIIPSPYYSQAYDRFAYVYNSPLRYTDPTGHCVDGITTWACIIAIGTVILKGIDYGWTGYDIYQSSRTLNNPNSNQTEKMFAGLNVALAVIFEAGEPDDLLPVGLPLDDAGRKLVMQGAKEAFEEGGEVALEKFLRDQLGDYSDEVIEKLGLGQKASPNDLHHIFDKPKHDLGGLLAMFDGDKQSAFNAVWREFSKVAGNYTKAELKEGVLVNVGGITIKVSGKYVDGVLRIGTFYVPK